MPAWLVSAAARASCLTTEASLTVVDWGRSSGYERLWAAVWEWNTASRRVLAKVGLTETERKEVDPLYGTSLFTTRRL